MTEDDAGHVDTSSAPVRATRPRARARSRALDLLETILASNTATAEAIAGALMVPVETIDAYRSGRLAMSLERQLLLAAFTIESASLHARRGHLLRGQIGATIAFATRETSTHMTPPSRASR